MKKAIITIAFILCASSVHAQSLKIDLAAYAIAASFDNVTTHVSLSAGAVERNSTLTAFGRTPNKVAATSIAIDTLGAVVLHKVLKNHRKIERVALAGLTGYRVWCGMHNLKTIQAMR